MLSAPKAVAWYEESLVQSGLASAAVAAIGALGITRGSVVLTVRTRLHEWADLLWHRAVISEVAQATLTVEQVFGPPPARDHRIVAATARAARTAARVGHPADPGVGHQDRLTRAAHRTRTRAGVQRGRPFAVMLTRPDRGERSASRARPFALVRSLASTFCRPARRATTRVPRNGRLRTVTRTCTTVRRFPAARRRTTRTTHARGRPACEPVPAEPRRRRG